MARKVLLNTPRIAQKDSKLSVSAMALVAVMMTLAGVVSPAACSVTAVLDLWSSANHWMSGNDHWTLIHFLNAVI